MVGNKYQEDQNNRTEKQNENKNTNNEILVIS